jgi:hypothetical protein
MTSRAHFGRLTLSARHVGWFGSVARLAGSGALFYGSSLFPAAVRGYAGSEVLAISNWILHRDDQVGRFLFSPIDQLEARVRGTAAT